MEEENSGGSNPRSNPPGGTLTEAELDWCLYTHRLDPLAIRLVHEVREARKLLGEAVDWIEAAEGAYGSPSLSVAARPREERIRAFPGKPSSRERCPNGCGRTLGPPYRTLPGVMVSTCACGYARASGEPPEATKESP
jgi:hypothetical protein